MRKQKGGSKLRDWAMKAHAYIKANKGYSRGAQFLMDRYGNRINNPHVRGLLQQGIDKLGQAGYGRYCRAYGARKCVSMYIGKDPNKNYRCAQYTTRACVKKRKPRRAVAYATRPGTTQLVMA